MEFRGRYTHEANAEIYLSLIDKSNQSVFVVT